MVVLEVSSSPQGVTLQPQSPSLGTAAAEVSEFPLPPLASATCQWTPLPGSSEAPRNPA